MGVGVEARDATNHPARPSTALTDNRVTQPHMSAALRVQKAGVCRDASGKSIGSSWAEDGRPLQAQPCVSVVASLPANLQS